MTSRGFVRWSLGAVVLLVPAFFGCSMIGLAVDASNQPDTLAVNHDEREWEGREVLITLNDGSVFAGECLRVGVLPDDFYRARYLSWQKQQGDRESGPALGDTVHVACLEGDRVSGTIRGFTRSSTLVVSSPRGPAPFLRGEMLARVPLESVKSIRLHGQTMDRQLFTQWLESAGVPRLEGILVRRGDTSAWIASDQIASVQEIRHDYSWFRTGALADAIGIAAILTYFVVQNR